MKNLYSLAVLFMLIFLTSCHKDEINPDKTKGFLHIDLGLQLEVKEIKKSLKSAEQTENFRVIIYNFDGTEKLSFNHASDMPDTIELSVGSYYAEAYSDNDIPAAFENPYYYGKSETFTITGNAMESVVINCILANTIVSVLYSDSVKNGFTDYNTTVSTDSGSLVFRKDETRKGYFKTMPINIQAELKYLKSDGTEMVKVLSGNITDPLPNRHYQIFVNSSIDEGMAGLRISADTTEATTEIVYLTETTADPSADEIKYGELLITEIMFDPSALSDTNGEWFEVYNNSNRNLNLQNLILRRDAVNSHTIVDSIVLTPGAYFVFNRNILANDAVNSYVYGSSISLPNTGAELSVYNKTVDNIQGSLIFSVNYGGSDFPSPSGASLNLDPGKFNASDAVLGSSWCISTSAYSTGDLGTPGEINDLCL